MNLEWDRLKVFYHVAKERSISRAAERLRTFQPSVTRCIRQLEHQAQSKLFIRNRKGLILTQQGEILFDHVKNAMTEIELAQNKISGAAEDVNGILKITTTYAYASTVLIQYLADFSIRYPHITLHVVCDDGLELDLIKRDADVAIRPYDPTASELEQVSLHERRTQLFASEVYLQKASALEKAEDLDNHKLIVFDPSRSITRTATNPHWILRVGLTPGNIRKPFMSINSAECLAQLAKTGLGIIALSDDSSLIEKYNLIRVLPTVEEPPVKMCYTYPRSSENLTIVKFLGSYLKETLKR